MARPRIVMTTVSGVGCHTLIVPPAVCWNPCRTGTTWASRFHAAE